MRNSSLTLNVTPRHNVVGLESTTVTTQVCATLQARELPDDVQRASVDIMIALDVSGSMSGDKLDLCKTTLEILLRQLTSEDSFGLVSFSGTAVLEIPAMRLTDSARKVAFSKIKLLRTRSSTNLSAAIGLAAQELYAMPQRNEVQSIFLLTDGEANNGITSVDGLHELTKICLASRKGTPTTMHCFGYGQGHNDALLRMLSSVTPGGTYNFVENDSAVAPAFGDALGGILSVVAQNAVLNITVPAAAREAGVKILAAYHENTIQIDDWNYKVTIGDFYAEESRDILFLVALSKSDLTIPHVQVSVSYSDTIEKALVVSPLQGCHIARPSSADMSVSNDNVEVQWLRIYSVQQMERANELSSRGKLKEARAEIAQAMEMIQNCGKDLQANPIVMQLVGDLNDTRRGLVSSTTYADFGASRLSSRAQSHQYQRSTFVEVGTANVYRSTKKASMARTFKNLTL